LPDYKDDIIWWNKFKEGDKQAFDSLFRHYYPVLFQYGSRLCPDTFLLEDSIQELFIELWQSKSSSQVQSVKAYLLKSLRYKLFRQLKKIQTDRPVDHLEEEMNFEVSHDQFLILQEEKNQVNRKIIDAVNKLPNRQKEIVFLKIYQGLNYEEISEIMGINYQVARNLFHQSVRSLRMLIM